MFRLTRLAARLQSIVLKNTVQIPCTINTVANRGCSYKQTYRNHNTKMNFPTPSMDPPKHEMAYFPDMTTSLPSESVAFRRVLWTGLYSQLVLMTVPVNGEIGDEVHRPCTRPEPLDSM